MSNRKLIPKKYIRTLVVFATLATVQSISAQQNTGSSPIDPDESLKQTNAILISKYMILQGYEALLITNPAEIQELVGLFRGNRTVGHACGYHWLIWFRHRPTITAFRSHNENCEIYLRDNTRVNSLLKTYTQRIKAQPSHFIYNVKVSSSVEPDEATRKLETSSHLVFFGKGPEERLPQVRIQARAVATISRNRKRWKAAEAKNLKVAEGKLLAAIERLKFSYSVSHHSKLENLYRRFGGGIIEDHVETTIYFSYGTNLDQVNEALHGVEILQRKIPTFYFLQLVTNEPDVGNIRRELLSQHQFVKDVFRFPDWK